MGKDSKKSLNNQGQGPESQALPDILRIQNYHAKIFSSQLFDNAKTDRRHSVP